MSPAYLVFDVDGTLVDSQHAIVAAMSAAFAALGLDAPAREAVLGVVGLSLEPAIARLLPEAPPSLHGELAAAYKAAYLDLRARGAAAQPLYPGAAALIRRLAAGPVLLGVATGKSRRGAEAVLDLHGLRGHFQSIRTADDGPGKPHPFMLEQAMGDVGAAPSDTVMIGDTVYDIEMARAAGARALAVSWGYHARAALEQAGAEAVAGHFDEIVPLAGALLGRPLAA